MSQCRGERIISHIIWLFFYHVSLFNENNNNQIYIYIFIVLGNHDYRGNVEAQLNPILKKIDRRWHCLRSFVLSSGKEKSPFELPLWCVFHLLPKTDICNSLILAIHRNCGFFLRGHYSICRQILFKPRASYLRLERCTSQEWIPSKALKGNSW